MEENLVRVWWSLPGCVLCKEPESLVSMLKHLQGSNLEGAEFTCAFKTHTFISWTAEISCCEVIFCENTNPPHTSHWKCFFCFQDKYLFLLIKREGFIFFSSLSLSKGHFFSQCTLQDPCWPTWLWEERVMAPRSSSPTPASPAHTASPCTGRPPTAPTGEQCWGHHGRYRRELGPLWGRQCRGAACTPSRLVGITDQPPAGFSQNRRVCMGRQPPHHLLTSGRSILQPGLSIPPTQRTSISPLQQARPCFTWHGSSSGDTKSKLQLLLLDAHPAPRATFTGFCWQKSA